MLVGKFARDRKQHRGASSTFDVRITILRDYTRALLGIKRANALIVGESRITIIRPIQKYGRARD